MSDTPDQSSASLRRVLLRIAAAFVGVAVAGYAIFPDFAILWLILGIFGLGAIIPAFQQNP